MPITDFGNRPIVFFDGRCPLCAGFIRFLFKIDRKGLFLAAPLQGFTAKKFLSAEETEGLRTVVLYHNGRKWIKSDAVLELFKRIGLPWSLFSLFSFLPKTLRDAIYQFISEYRYKVFGKFEKAEESPLTGVKKHKRILD